MTVVDHQGSNPWRAADHSVKLLQHPRFPHRVQDPVEERMQHLGRNRVEHLAHLIVAGDSGDAEEALGVVATALLPHRLLVGYKGRRLGEEDREGAPAEVLHGVRFVGATTPVRQLGQFLAQVIEPPVEERSVHEQRRWRQGRPSGRTNTSLAVVKAVWDGPLRPRPVVRPTGSQPAAR